MQFSEIIQRAKQIREKYAALEKKQDGKEWTKEQIMQGFLGDVEDLKKILSSEVINNDKLAHELSDCLWSVIILADKYQIDLKTSFMKTMDELDERIAEQKRA